MRRFRKKVEKSGKSLLGRQICALESGSLAVTALFWYSAGSACLTRKRYLVQSLYERRLRG